MKTTPLMLTLSTTFALLAGAGLWLSAAHSGTRAAGGVRASSSEITDKALTSAQSELLELAFKTASAIPAHPHIKDRSRAQAEAVAACLELDQPRRAQAYAAEMGNWRRGESYAEIAFYCAKHGDAAQAQRCLEQAVQMASSLKSDDDDQADGEPASDGGVPIEIGQSWRRDRIKVNAARTLALLGEDEQAAALEAGVVDSETGKVDGVRASQLDSAAFDERLASFAQIISSSNVDQARTAMEACAQLYDRFFDDHERRERVERTIRDAGAKLPGATRIEVMMELAGFALDHSDPGTALAVVEETKLITGSCTHVPFVARLAGLRYRAGDQEKARKEVDLARALFDQQRSAIVNIERAGLLRPLAEAYQAMGDRPDALAVYKRALEEGVENPNSRPRAEDLSATCLSLAVYGVEPDADLMARVYEIYGKLGSPW